MPRHASVGNLGVGGQGSRQGKNQRLGIRRTRRGPPPALWRCTKRSPGKRRGREEIATSQNDRLRNTSRRRNTETTKGCAGYRQGGKIWGGGENQKVTLSRQWNRPRQAADTYLAVTLRSGWNP